MNQNRPTNARLAAVDAIARVLDTRQSLADYYLPRTFPEASDLSPRDKAFARHLAYGVLRWLGALEWLAGQLLNAPLKRRDGDIQRLVLIGLFQLWKDEAADHAAVHATTECARLLGKNWATGLINALLRRFVRERKQLLAQLESTPDQYAHPAWLLDLLEQDWPQCWQSVVSANNRQAALWLRVNRRLSAPGAMIAELAQQGFNATSHAQAGDAICVEPPVPVTQLPGFDEGRLSVQDPAAQLAADFLAPARGERILDACAAPGGKTCHLLERQPGIELLALDQDEKRLGLIRDNLHRLGLKCQLKCAEATQPEAWWDGIPFDKILLDAPCSTTGVIRRHPEIKWLRDPAQVHRVVATQQRLLERLWPLLDTGGILVYATCSILKCENHKQIHGFLSRHPDAVYAGPNADVEEATLPGRQILPGQEGMDGFYYAVIRKSV